MNMDVNTGAIVVTITALGLFGYTYLGYPVLLWLVGKMTAPLRTVPAGPSRATRWPTVSVVISAHNEAAVIGRRIVNLLEQNYPQDRLQILIGSDGSTDGTGAYLTQQRFPRTQCMAFQERRGKASVLNDLVARATGEYLIFTDATTVFYPDAIKQLITGFAIHPGAVVVGGHLEIRSSDTSQSQDGLYWRYEMFLKSQESDSGAGLGVSGAIYAIRRKDYQPLPAQTMADDLLQPLLIRLRTHGDVVLHHAAKAWVAAPKRVADEFHRRVRTGAGIVHVLSQTWPLLLPRWGKVALALWSHKALRVAAPWLLFAAMVGNLWLLDQPMFRATFAAQLALYTAALGAGLLRPIPLIGKAAQAAQYFLVLNAALAVGAIKFMMGGASPTWNRTQRPAEAVPFPSAWTGLEPQQAADRERPAA
jgi:cellulose synthase/poly-beta-1,6-N-acetylglucosamine synthase-like glycosyltransferase